MTERKPPGVSFESWTDKQIREAERRGDFAGLPGAGKPLPSLDAPYDAMWWVKGKMQREGLSVLPASLMLRKEAEDAIEAVARARTEAQVRRIIGEINDKLRVALARPPEGPPLGRGLFDVEQVIADWRAAQPEPAPERRESGQQSAGEASAARGRGFGRLFRRGRSA